ncbi:nuclear protein MDM1 [Biomphalaria glabrata]|nr:nuclear protein MDM1 [Biomphalaria glabrata]
MIKININIFSLKDTVAEPPLQHKKRVDGIPTSLSTQFFTVPTRTQEVSEPALQHKKRLEGQPTSLSSDFFSTTPQAPEFQLLGQQEKFASNVCYKPKLSYSEEKIYKNRENLDRDAPPNKQLKMQKRIKPLIKERHPPINRSPPRKSNVQQMPIDSPPPAPRGHRDNLELKEAMKDKDLKDILGEGQAGKKISESAPSEKKVSNEPKSSEQGSGAKTLNEEGKENRKVEQMKVNKAVVKQDPTSKDFKVTKKSDALKDYDSDNQAVDSKQRKHLSVMNEAVQTNLKRGVAVATPEAPAGYALQYKAGVAPPRPVQKVSEYQKQFQWKQGLKESPLLAAEQVVYKSQADLGPYKSDGVPRISEYARHFQAKKPFDVHVDANLNVNNSNVTKQTSKNNKTTKLTAQKRRSKSAGALQDSDLDEHLVEDKEVRKSDSKELIEKLKATHGKIKRRAATEYRSNFKAPSRYSYENGAWKGAFPPQLIPQVTSDDDSLKTRNSNANDNNNANESVPVSNWYAEVLELRRRAEEYRRRAQGTHFSREHLVQLLAKQAECWDTCSEASYAIDALNLETPYTRKKIEPALAQKENTSQDDADDDTDDAASALTVEGDVVPKKTEKKSAQASKGTSHLSRKMEWLKRQKRSLAEQRRKLQEELARPPDDDSEDEVTEGRLPTPLLRKQTFSPVRRHHLDRTTPSVGGAILTCPPTRTSKIIVTSRSGDSYVTASDEMPVRIQAKSYDVSKLATLPTLGRPSDDTHPLRDDMAESDKPLKTQYIVSPPLPLDEVETEEDDKENAPKPANARDRRPRPSMLGTVKEGFGETFITRSPEASRRRVQKDDQDFLSESLSSVASSGSRASEVLERSKQRQKFWTKTSGHH